MKMLADHENNKKYLLKETYLLMGNPNGTYGYFKENEISEELKNKWRKMGGRDFHIMQPEESTPLLDAYAINEENICEIILLSRD